MSSRRVLLLVLPALIATLLVATPAAAQAATFRDVAGSVHAPAVSALAGESIILGCTDARFCPADGLTRGQVASILSRALDLEPAATANSGTATAFTDTAGSVHRAAIATIADAGLTVGCTGREFCPNDPITRGQLATLLARAVELPAAPSGTYFTDIDGVHRASIEAMAHAGVAAGCDLVAFCPSHRLTRAQGATFVARALDLVPRVRLAPFAERRAEHDAQRAAEAATRTTSGAARAVEVARAQVGKPYRWGGNGPASFDCSGLTRYAWSAAGVNLPRTSGEQYNATRRISRSDLQPGDLIFYYRPIGHVAMYIGGGRIVEAPTSNNTVRIASDGLGRSGIVGYGRPR
jgi:cell wall-associated NlpC family hydrolase